MNCFNLLIAAEVMALYVSNDDSPYCKHTLMLLTFFFFVIFSPSSPFQFEFIHCILVLFHVYEFFSDINYAHIVITDWQLTLAHVQSQYMPVPVIVSFD